MSELPPIVVNAEEQPEHERTTGDHWGARFRALTPGMAPRGGSLGVNQMIVPKGRTAVPFHAHMLEDEVFYVLSGRGVLRYGEELFDLKPGDCVSCAAGTRVAHQIANPYEEDLVYLSIGPRDENEVCTYPDTGKVMVRSIGTVGLLEKTEYMHGEPEKPKIFDLIGDGKAE